MTDPAFQEIATKHGFSAAAASAVYDALSRSHGSMAQFSHPELGGSGQWMRGGMLMIGDMFNHSLKARVDALCRDLSDLVRSRPAPDHRYAETEPSNAWWPKELGRPGSVGGQNDFSYAYFADKNRLAIRFPGGVSVFDTTGHSVHGFGQQQQSGGLQGLYLSSQNGSIAVLSLPRVT